MNLASGDIIVGGEVIFGKLVGGTIYSQEQWAAKLLDEKVTRIEQKLDLILAALNIEPKQGIKL